MDEQVKRLRVRLARMPRGRGKRYTSELKKQIAAAAMRLRGSGMGWHRIGEALGIPNETVRRFCGAAGRAATGEFVPVVVADGGGAAPVLVTASGLRVEGLDIEQVAQLLLRLGR
jgi:glycosyltransferase involved in cell wall biosynthesis